MRAIILFALFLFSTSCVAQGKWKHIESKERLEVLKDSVLAIGKVQRCYRYLDGDFVIELKLDTNFTLTGPGNFKKLQGLLEVEVICQHRTANLKCCGYSNTVTIPKKGDRILVTGTWVYDKRHGWNEIHPVQYLVILND